MNLVGKIEPLTEQDVLAGTGCRPVPYLDEERVREIVREELKKLLSEGATGLNGAEPR